MDTLIGSMPETWHELRLADLCDVLAGPSGASLPLTAFAGTGVPVVAPKDIQKNRIDGGTVGTVEVAVAEALTRYRLAPGDIVCSRRGELGRHALVGEEQDGWILGTACLRLRPTDPTVAGYLNAYLGHPLVSHWVRRNATGSAIPSVSANVMRSMPVVMPPTGVRMLVADIVAALDDKIAVHDEISRTTSALRAALLPLLLNGSMTGGLAPDGSKEMVPGMVGDVEGRRSQP
jgi:restriction endonuclease S subunit